MRLKIVELLTCRNQQPYMIVDSTTHRHALRCSRTSQCPSPYICELNTRMYGNFNGVCCLKDENDAISNRPPSKFKLSCPNNRSALIDNKSRSPVLCHLGDDTGGCV